MKGGAPTPDSVPASAAAEVDKADPMKGLLDLVKSEKKQGRYPERARRLKRTVNTPEGPTARALLPRPLYFLVGPDRFELSTNGLRVRCSTN